MKWIIAAALLAQNSPNELPPGHPLVSSPETAVAPALPEPSTAGQLPPGHPPLGSARPLTPDEQMSGALPPGHPATTPAPASARPLTPEQEASGQLPAGHPGLGAPAPTGSEGVAPPADLPAGHPKVNPNDRPMSAGDLLKKLDATPDLRTREKTFEVAAALGKLYYGNSRFPEAVVYLRQALAKTEPTRALYLDAKRKVGTAALPSAAAAGCAPGPQSTLDSITQAARERAKAGKPAEAAACARIGVDSILDSERVVADALFLTGDASGALAELDRAVALDDQEMEISFLRGAVRLDSQGDDVKALRTAKADFDRVASVAPQSPRANTARELSEQAEKAIAAGGMTKLDAVRAKEDKSKPVAFAAKAPPFAPFAGGAAPPFAGGGGAGAPALSQEAMDAVRNTERTPELMQGMQKLIEEGETDLAQGRYQEALDAYKRVVPFQPENGRAKAGMAWALVGLGKPMADRVWMVAVQADPSSVDKLGDTLKSKGDEKGAKGVWQKLAASDPSYAQRAGLAQKL